MILLIKKYIEEIICKHCGKLPSFFAPPLSRLLILTLENMITLGLKKIGPAPSAAF